MFTLTILFLFSLLKLHSAVSLEKRNHRMNRLQGQVKTRVSSLKRHECFIPMTFSQRSRTEAIHLSGVSGVLHFTSSTGVATRPLLDRLWHKGVSPRRLSLLLIRLVSYNTPVLSSNVVLRLQILLRANRVQLGPNRLFLECAMHYASDINFQLQSKNDCK